MTEYTSHLKPRLPWENLKDREAEVVRWKIRGYRNREVGKITGLKAGYVKNMLSEIYSVLDIRNSGELTYFAMRDGFVKDEIPEDIN